jgi:predicted enzyme related to lactoylglutathione lyase
MVHFEIPADDVERAKKFYSELFGWKISRWEGLKSANEYWLIDSSDGKNKSTISGGIIRRQAPGHPFMNYVGVDSIDAYLEKAARLGGKVVLPKQVIAGVGAFAAFMDSENNIIGLHEMDKGSKFGVKK